jgi:integrase
VPACGTGGLRVDDISWLVGGDAKILVRRAKTDPFGDGRWAYLSVPTARRLKSWLETAQIDEGAIFRGLNRGHVQPGSRQPLAVNRMLKATARRAGLSPATLSGLSGHSMRVGAAQDLMVAGSDLLQIMTAGGWASIDVVSRMVRRRTRMQEAEMPTGHMS